MRYNLYRLPIVEAGCDLISNEAYRAWRLQESLRRLHEMSASAKNHQTIELADQTSGVTEAIQQ